MKSTAKKSTTTIKTGGIQGLMDGVFSGSPMKSTAKQSTMKMAKRAAREVEQIVNSAPAAGTPVVVTLPDGTPYVTGPDKGTEAKAAQKAGKQKAGKRAAKAVTAREREILAGQRGIRYSEEERRKIGGTPCPKCGRFNIDGKPCTNPKACERRRKAAPLPLKVKRATKPAGASKGGR